MADFKHNFKDLRLKADLTQEELGKRLGISKSAVSMYERGERRPDFDLLEQIADFFSVDVNYLVGASQKVDRLTGTQADENSIGSPYVLLNDDERALVKAFRLASADTRNAVKAVLGIGDK